MQTAIHIAGWVLCALSACLGGLLTLFNAIAAGIFSVIGLFIGFILTLVVIP